MFAYPPDPLNAHDHISGWIGANDPVPPTPVRFLNSPTLSTLKITRPFGSGHWAWCTRQIQSSSLLSTMLRSLAGSSGRMLCSAYRQMYPPSGMRMSPSRTVK